MIDESMLHRVVVRVVLFGQHAANVVDVQVQVVEVDDVMVPIISIYHNANKTHAQP